MRAMRPSHVRQTPPASAAARLSACPSSGSPSASSRSGSSSPPFTSDGGRQAERDDRRARAEPALARDPNGELEAVAARVREQRERANAEMLRDPARRPRSTSSSFQRSNAAAAQSKPGPRFAVVAGARTRTASRQARDLDDRSTSTSTIGSADPLDGVRILEPVPGDHDDDGARRADLPDRGDARGARRLAEDALELGETAATPRRSRRR